MSYSIYDIFMQILNMSLMSSFIICAVFGIRLFLKKAPKIFCYLLWGVVLFRLLCPAAVSSSFSALRLWKSPVTENGSMAFLADPAEKDISIPKTDDISSSEDFERKSSVPTEDAPSKDAMLPSGSSIRPKNPSIFYGSILWLAGIFAMTGYGIISAFLLKRRLIGSVRIKDNIYISDHIDTPFTMGIISPKIYLSGGLSEKEKHFIILHEQTHIRRGDTIIKLLSFFALTIHWFNPLVWAAFFISEKDMEMSCDEAVMKKMDEDIRTDYSNALLCLASGKRMIRVTPLAFGEGNTKSRVKNVMQYKKPAIFTVFIAAIFLIICLFAFCTNPKAGKQTDAASSGSAPVNTTADTYLDDDELENKAIQWAEAFCRRDGNTIAAMSSPKTKETLKKAGLLEELSETWTFGFSSPWPWLPDSDYQILSAEDGIAEILYYARTSKPHVCVWKETLSFTRENTTWIAAEESLQYFDSIRSLEEFQTAYPNGIMDTPMDYIADNTAESLNDNALLSSDWTYQNLSDPETAAINLLNLSENDVTATAQEAQEDGSVPVNLRFDDGSATVTMVCPFAKGEFGIWVPRDLEGADDEISEDTAPENFLYSKNAFLGTFGSETEFDNASYQTRTVYSTTADITHDGISDKIDVIAAADVSLGEDPNSSPSDLLSGVGFGYLKVYKGIGNNEFEDTPIYTSAGFSGTHASNGQICLVKKDGQDYLMISNMYAIMGSASYYYVVFYIDTEQETAVCADESSVGFDVDERYPAPGEEPIRREDVLPDFKKQLEQWTDDSVVFISCDVSSDPEILVSEPGREYTASDYYDKVWER